MPPLPCQSRLLAAVPLALLLAAPARAAAPPAKVAVEWVPRGDVLEDVLARVRWGMSVAELRKAFRGCAVSGDRWVLTRGSFRNELTLTYPNTKVVFTFSGVVNAQAREPVPVSSCLVGFSILHPVKQHPRTPFVRPPDSLHYRYVKRMHDRYAARLRRRKVAHQAGGLFHRGYGYLFWERCRSEQDGELTFVYWSNTRDVGVFARAPDRAVRSAVGREQESARARTRDWPREVCGFDLRR